MPYAIRIHETGGPEVLRWEEVEVGKPGPGEVLVRNSAVGLNFTDIYNRSGLYPIPLPATLGREGAGVVETVGSKVKDFKPGDRVAYVDPTGSYAEVLLRPAERLVKIPAGVGDQTAAAMMLKGMTAQFLLRRTYRVKKGDTILVHAAAGGVGQILCQWARHLGVRVIGTVGSEAKVPLAKKAGCKHVLVTARDKISERVKEITKGAGVPVVYDGVGKDTFMDSLDCLAPLGLMVTYGNASGPVPAFSPTLLTQKGSLFITRPTLGTYIAKREDLVRTARELFAVVKKGAVKIAVNQTYPLREAAQAHRDLESRKTTGSTILLP
ncbi:MAG: quinone oxidoreductase family protein [Gammaproteobacteria bacterium]